MDSVAGEDTWKEVLLRLTQSEMLPARLVCCEWGNIVNGICRTHVNTTFADLMHHHRVISGYMKIAMYDLAHQHRLIAQIVRQMPAPKLPPIGWMRLICFLVGPRRIEFHREFICHRVWQSRDNLEYVKLFYAAGIIDMKEILRQAGLFYDHSLSCELFSLVREPWPRDHQYDAILQIYTADTKVGPDLFTLVLNNCPDVNYYVIWKRCENQLVGDNLLIWINHIDNGLRGLIYAGGRPFFATYGPDMGRQLAMACAPDRETAIQDCKIWFPA